MHGRAAGQALVWLTMMLPMFMSVAGLAIDGGLLLISHRQLQSVADGAARAGATRLDVDRLRSSGGLDVQLDRAAAGRSARSYIDDALAHQQSHAQSVSTTIDVGTRRVEVSLQSSLPTAFLRLAHIDSVPVMANARADVRYGIRDGNGGGR